MRGQFILVVGGVTIGVAALAFAATAAYAAPPSTSSSVLADSPALVIPHDYHPNFSSGQIASTLSGGVTVVAPHAAEVISDRGPAAAPPPATPGSSTPAPGAASPPPAGPAANPPAGPAVGPAAGPATSDPAGPPAASPPSPPSAPVPPGSAPETNKGNDLGNKGTGSNKGKGKGGP